MLKILWKRGKIAPQEQFLPLSTIFYYMMLDFYVKTGIRFSLRDKRLFEITEVEITRVDCTHLLIVAAFRGGQMVLGQLPVPGHPVGLDRGRGQGPTALEVGVGGVAWTLWLRSIISLLSPSLGVGSV